MGNDQRWTLLRVRELIASKFGVSYSLKGVALVLHAMDWTVQVPDAKASDRDEEAITAWRKKTWPTVKGSRAGWARGSASWTSPRTR
nr:winged helix-turn-helix domain-containing protein [Glycomyces sp. L485]